MGASACRVFRGLQSARLLPLEQLTFLCRRGPGAGAGSPQDCCAPLLPWTPWTRAQHPNFTDGQPRLRGQVAGQGLEAGRLVPALCPESTEPAREGLGGVWCPHATTPLRTSPHGSQAGTPATVPRAPKRSAREQHAGLDQASQEERGTNRVPLKAAGPRRLQVCVCSECRARPWETRPRLCVFYVPHMEMPGLPRCPGTWVTAGLRALGCGPSEGTGTSLSHTSLLQVVSEFHLRAGLGGGGGSHKRRRCARHGPFLSGLCEPGPVPVLHPSGAERTLLAAVAGLRGESPVLCPWSLSTSPWGQKAGWDLCRPWP